MSRRPWHLIRAILSGATALVLLAAAVFKLLPLLNDLVRFDIFEITDALIVALVVAEVGAALLLLASPHQWQSWLVALLMFLGFLVAATAIAVQGRRSCGCLGELSVTPWVIATLDAVVVVAASFVLWTVRRSGSNATSSLRAAHCCAVAILFPVVGGLLFLGISTLQSTGHLAGPVLVAVKHDVKANSSTNTSNVSVVPVSFSNATSRSIRVVGAKLGCDTRLLSQLPLTLAPGTTASLEVVTRIPEDVPRATLELTLYTSGTSRLEQSLKFSVSCR